jgi:two-component system sensor histidine kinase CpxA
MVANIPSIPGFDFILPYLVVVLPTLLWLCYSLIRDIASPLKSLTLTLDHFGHGDLSARMRSRRKDQIGDLARSFDAMAERIQVLLQAERRLLQDVAHELRSPLARLTLATGLLSEETTRQRGIGQIRRDIDRLKLLIGALLQVTRAEGDRSTLKFVPTNVPQLLDEVIADCRLEADAQACRIEPRIAGNVSVSADAELLRRAIENILRNAIKYSPENGVIDLALESGASEVAIVVRDYGPGVADEMLLKIILPFFRVDEARDGLTGGAGLGLAIADRAIQLHKGKILVRNASPGLRVSLMLPLEVSTQ